MIPVPQPKYEYQVGGSLLADAPTAISPEIYFWAGFPLSLLRYCHIFRQINILNRVKQLDPFLKRTLECLASRN